MQVDVRHDIATFPARDGQPIPLHLDANWWDEAADVTALLTYVVGSFGDSDEVDVSAVAPALEAGMNRARPEHDRLADLDLLRKGLPVGQLARDIAARPEPEHPYLVPGVIRERGVTLISGREKRSGKSTLVASLVGALERCEPTLFGPAYPSPVRTVWATEEPEYALREKIVRFGLEDVYFIGLGEWTEARNVDVDLGPFSARMAALQKIALAYGAKHIVIDPLSRIAGIEDEAGAGELNRACNDASVLAQRAGVAVTLIHHDNKADGRAVEDKMRGSTATSAAVDQIIHIERRWPKVDPTARELVAWGRVRESEWVKTIRLNDDDTYSEIGSLEDANHEAAQRADVDLLAQMGTATNKTFAEAIGLSEQGAGKRLKALVRQGLADEDSSSRPIVYAATET
jgi:hypothetical protein